MLDGRVALEPRSESGSPRLNAFSARSRALRNVSRIKFLDEGVNHRSPTRSRRHTEKPSRGPAPVQHESRRAHRGRGNEGREEAHPCTALAPEASTRAAF